MATGFMPAVTYFNPSVKIASAKTVEVVVPSPTSAEVLLATWLTIFAPIFLNGSGSSISLLTVTPSLVTFGEPQLLCRMTFLPVGPSVTLTASASCDNPSLRCARAVLSNINSFAIFYYSLLLSSSLLLNNPQYVAFTQNHDFFAINFYFTAYVFRVDDLIIFLHVHLGALTVIEQLARPDSNYFADLRFFFRRSEERRVG